MDKTSNNNKNATDVYTVLANRLCFRAWVESQKFMAIQGTPDLETMQSFMHNYSDEKYIMQYTGLNDINGNKIFEMDIVEYTQHHFNTDMTKIKLKVVKWKYDKWGVYETNAGESNVKIIGNVFENPDLFRDVL
jgi:uncharacterized phage protein (TIGR01671 family)